MTAQSKSEGAPATRLPATVVLLGWVSFFADISSEMAYPLLPLFVVGVLGASATTLGGIEGCAVLLVSAVSAWAGLRSDRRRRRVPFVRIGYGLPVIGKTLIALAGGWPVVLVGRLVDRLGKGLRGSPRDALIADVSEARMRGRAFGFHRSMDTAGALLGVLLAAGILFWLTGAPAAEPDDSSAAAIRETEHSVRLVLVISAGLGVVSLILTLLLREPAPTVAIGGGVDEEGPESSAAGWFGLPWPYWRTISPLLVFSLANSSDAFLLLRAGGLGLSPWSVVLAYALYNLTYTIFSYPAGAISDRIGRWRVIAVGWMIYAVVYAGFAASGIVGIWPLFGLYGLYMALTDGVGKALVTDHVPARKRGTALGVFFLASGLLALAASLVAGVLWDRFGPAVTFWAGSATAVVAVLLSLLQREPKAAPATSPQADEPR